MDGGVGGGWMEEWGGWMEEWGGGWMEEWGGGWRSREEEGGGGGMEEICEQGGGICEQGGWDRCEGIESKNVTQVCVDELMEGGVSVGRLMEGGDVGRWRGGW